jgi:hypothetical protein
MTSMQRRTEKGSKTEHHHRHGPELPLMAHKFQDQD